MTKPQLLRIPCTFHSVADVLETALKLDLPNVLVLAERENGNIVLLDSGLSCAQVNWIADRVKQIVLDDKPVFVGA